MRAGIPFSVALHLAIAAAGIVVAPTLTAEPSPMVILPVELLTIAESTNVAPVAETAPEIMPQDEPVEIGEEEIVEAEAATSAPEEAPEIIPTARADEAEKTPAPKVQPKPAPKEESFDDFLESTLKSVEKKKPARAAASKTAADLRKVEDAPRKGVGDNTRMTMTIADAIRSQLLSRGCWGDQDDMPDAKRLRAVIRVRFERDGTLMGAPELREPGRVPSGDPPMQIFVQRAMRALDMCNRPKYLVPPEYYETTPAQWIDLEFVP